MANRNTAIRDRDRRRLRQGEPVCYMCGNPIDYQAGPQHPESYVVDHVTPLEKGGADTIDNKRPAHRKCNSLKGTRIVAPVVRRSGALN